MKLDDILIEAKIHKSVDSKWLYWYDGIWRAYNVDEGIEYNAYHRSELAMLIDTHGPEYDEPKQYGGFPPPQQVKPLTPEQLQKVLG